MKETALVYMKFGNVHTFKSTMFGEISFTDDEIGEKETTFNKVETAVRLCYGFSMLDNNMTQDEKKELVFNKANNLV